MDNRKIDQLVALRLLGYTEIKNDVGTTTWLVDEPNEQSFFFLGNEREFSPSERIEDAWQVVKELRENYFEISITIGEDIINVEVSTTIDDPKKVYYAYQQESLPLAICKAALKTVGVEV
ncbi:hypothetical protein GCM10008934_02740 [Virgibacillus salarius]|uniref:BC1872 family protein n=1 Tax=Virgibacillus salarius TaxID=447199 RepID=UPI0031DAD811